MCDQFFENPNATSAESMRLRIAENWYWMSSKIPSFSYFKFKTHIDNSQWLASVRLMTIFVFLFVTSFIETCQKLRRLSNRFRYCLIHHKGEFPNWNIPIVSIKVKTLRKFSKQYCWKRSNSGSFKESTLLSRLLVSWSFWIV